MARPKKECPACGKRIFYRDGKHWIEYHTLEGNRRREPAGSFKQAEELLTVKLALKAQGKHDDKIGRVKPTVEMTVKELINNYPSPLSRRET